MWILTSEVNDYNQHGEYFEAAWINKPTLDQLRKVVEYYNDDYLEHILKGGGRIYPEETWYNLYEYNEK